jgi:hypothetical protein
MNQFKIEPGTFPLHSDSMLRHGDASAVSSDTSLNDTAIVKPFDMSV